MQPCTGMKKEIPHLPVFNSSIYESCNSCPGNVSNWGALNIHCELTGAASTLVCLTHTLSVRTCHGAWVGKDVHECGIVEVSTCTSVLCNENRLLQHDPSGRRCHTQVVIHSRQWRE